MRQPLTDLPHAASHSAPVEHGRRLVIVDGEPDYLDANEPVVVQTAGVTHTFDWFEGCEVVTLDGAITVLSSTLA